MILNHNLYAPLYSLLKRLFSSAPHVPHGLLNAATTLSRRQPLGWGGTAGAMPLVQPALESSTVGLEEPQGCWGPLCLLRGDPISIFWDALLL